MVIARIVRHEPHDARPRTDPSPTGRRGDRPVPCQEVTVATDEQQQSGSRGGRTELAERALRFILDLPTDEQLWVYAQMTAALGDEISAYDDPRIDVALRREAALADMRLVAEHLGLPDGVPPNSSQYREHQEAAGAAMSVSTIAEDVFERWSYATRAYRDEPLPTSRAVTDVHQALGRRSGDDIAFAEPLDGVRQWLDTGPEKLGAETYKRWVAEQNRRRDDDPDGPDSPVAYLLSSAKVMALLGNIEWAAVLAVARDETTLAEVLAERRDAQNALDADDLVTERQIKELLAGRKPRRGTKPAVAVKLGNTRGWLAADVSRYIAGERPRDLADCWLQDDVISLDQLAAALGTNSNTLSRRLREPAHTDVPAPRALGAVKWWYRRDIEPHVEALRRPTRRRQASA